MAYEKTVWKNGDVITEEKLNHIEDGIAELDLPDRIAELQAELDEAISGATADSEVINARVDSEGTTYGTLKQRLDAENTALKNELLQHQASIEDILLTKVLTDAQKNAILACFRNVAWINDQGQTYYEALQVAFDVSVTSISAVYTQSGIVYDTQTLDDLRQNLVVNATMSDGTTSAVKGYALSGSLTAGTSTITVTYADKTTTFDVTVTHMQGSLVSISAVMDSSATITTNDSLEDLRQYLTVTAHYDSGDDVVVTGYTLSGSLDVGQNSITVSYSNKTTTFTVTVIKGAYITASFNAGGEAIYEGDDLDSLKQYLVVTYYAAGESTGTVIADNDYSLSGTLTEGTRTIFVSYQGYETSFTVVVTNPFIYRLPNTPVVIDGSNPIDTGVQLLADNRSFTVACDFVDNRDYPFDTIQGWVFSCYTTSNPYQGLYLQIYDGGNIADTNPVQRKIRHIMRCTPPGTSGGQTIFDNALVYDDVVGRNVRFCFAYNSTSGTAKAYCSVNGTMITPTVNSFNFTYVALQNNLIVGGRKLAEGFSNVMDCVINDFKVFNSALSDTEMQAYISEEG